MTRIKVVDGVLLIDFIGIDKLAAFAETLTVPMGNVVSYRRANASDFISEECVVGVSFPDYEAGLFLSNGVLALWDVRDRENCVVIELRNEHFAKLVLEVENVAVTLRILASAE